MRINHRFAAGSYWVGCCRGSLANTILNRPRFMHNLLLVKESPPRQSLQTYIFLAEGFFLLLREYLDLAQNESVHSRT